MKNDFDYDVGIIGGGPAGATMAAYLAQAGISCVVFEGETFERPHIGESLVPATTPILIETGVMEKIEAAGFPKKFGAAWTSAQSGPENKMGFTNLDHNFSHAEVLFNERSQDGVDRDYTFHVDRGKFDRILLENARDKGARIYQGVKVKSAEIPAAGDARITVELAGHPVEVKTRMIVDASGRHCFLGRKMGLRQPDPYFNQFAIHTWFENFDRSLVTPHPEKLDYIFIHFIPLDNTWVWQIPISKTVTSFGVVSQKQIYTSSGLDRESYFWKTLESRPDLYKALRAAKRLRPYKSEADYSYSMKEICGDSFVLIGDAARFVDPIFSSGVSVALKSARFASRDIIRALEKNDLHKESFSNYETILGYGVRNWYEFITLYYRLNILFTAFVQDPRYRLDILKLLQGEVYSSERPPVLIKMREIVNIVEKDPQHLWYKYLGGIKNNLNQYAQ